MLMRIRPNSIDLIEEPHKWKTWRISALFNSMQEAGEKIIVPPRTENIIDSKKQSNDKFLNIEDTAARNGLSCENNSDKSCCLSRLLVVLSVKISADA